ncbi:hypothetical protein LCGC14_2075520 [marine sediment metagenome]|uniref:Uncharacterized protein n=1 Tax=marine sediment metagenome TaxID=412755 RepID=A0A0F9GVG7_9ZZZZ
MTELLQMLSAGGDIAMIALFGLMWRLDRRVVRLETLLNGKKK